MRRAFAGWFFVLLFSSACPSLARAQKTVTQSSAAATAPGIIGNYAGTLQAGEAQLHLVLHLDKLADGTLHATLDSLDQAVYAIEATSVSLSASTLKLEVASVGARFEGKVSSDRKTIDGTWSQGNASLPLTFKRQVAGHATGSQSAPVSPVEGIWQGVLETHNMRLRYQLHVSHDSEGELIASLDNLDQGVAGLPAMGVALDDKSQFVFEIPAMGGKFQGTLDAAKKTLKGNWTQTGAESVLEFKRSDIPLPLRRPQNPVPPYPYVEKEVLIHNTAAKVDLAGTLTLPNGTGPFPAAILIAGSGPHDRDETMSGHKPFLVISDQLTRKGVAVLRYDKRGIGKSTGSVDAATTLDFASDAQVALEYLKSRKEVDATRIGLIGHSEGAMIAPYVAVHSPDVKWLVLLGAPATKGQDTMLHQSELIGEVGGLSRAQLLASLTFDREAYDVVRKEQDPIVITAKIQELVRDSGLDAALPPAALETQLRMLSSPWFRFFLDYDPMPILKMLTTPTLALYGQKDLQVAAKFNLPLMKQALKESGNQDYEVKELPDLNHLLQHCFSGSPTEYAAIEETISPEALQMIQQWLIVHAPIR